MRLDRFRPTPSMAVAMTALVISASGVTWAATSLPDDSVDSSTIKNNSVRSVDIRNGQVKRSDVNRNAVAGEEVLNNTLTGDDIFEPSLAEVPLASNADRADHAANADQAHEAAFAEDLRPSGAAQFWSKRELVPLNVELSFGQKVEIVRNGPVALEADCRANITTAGQDELRLLAQTTEDGSFMQGDTPHSGPGVGSDFLNTDTPEDNRTMGGVVTTAAGEGQPAVEDDIDTGFVAGPNGDYIGIDETTMYGLNIGGGDCLLVGYAVLVR